MNRLEKKCFTASMATHGLMVVILLVGPGFFAARQKTDSDLKVASVIPSTLVDALVSGGGNPDIKPPTAVPEPSFVKPPPEPPKPAAPPEPPQPRPPEVVKPPPLPDPPKPIVKIKPPTHDFDLTERTPPRKPEPHRVEINTALVKRQPPKVTENTSEDEAEAKAQARAAAKAQARRERAVQQLMSGLKDGLSTPTTIDYGPGGPDIANYALIVKTFYERAWVVPDSVTADDGMVKVSVTIARDGTVVTSRVVRSSGDSAVDRSVERTLERVRFIAPFPDGAREAQRTFTINFNLKAKRSTE